MDEQEKKLIQLIEAGDFDGLELLIDLFGTDILRTIQYVLNHPSEHSHIQDVQNKVFFRLWRQLPNYDQDQSSLKTWITVITRNLALDEKRRIIRELKITPMADVPEDEGAEEHYFAKENFLDLVATLSSEDQLIFLKFYFHQNKVEEIASDLALSKEVIYNRLSRGRQKLATTLRNEGGLTHD